MTSLIIGIAGYPDAKTKQIQRTCSLKLMKWECDLHKEDHSKAVGIRVVGPPILHRRGSCKPSTASATLHMLALSQACPTKHTLPMRAMS